MSLYHLLRPFLFLVDPEKAHGLAMKALRKGLVLHPKPVTDDVLKTTVAGLDFPNPLGLAAGFDKQAEAMDDLLALGFGHLEVGTITPKPQVGNPRPRLFRIPAAEALINRFGFNSDGASVCRRRLVAYNDATTRVRRGIVGVNIGKNKESTDAIADYVTGWRTFAAFADYITINVSSPNTPGLRGLQNRDELKALLAQVMAARATMERQPPVFVKVAPDLDAQQVADMADVILEAGVHGIIIGNTTVKRPAEIPQGMAAQAGGLSGRPLFAQSTTLLADFYQQTKGKIPLIGCGGVFSAEDAYAKIRAGASLVQLYTGFIYEGPWIAAKINQRLAVLLVRDGFKTVSEAVGSGVKNR